MQRPTRRLVPARLRSPGWLWTGTLQRKVEQVGSPAGSPNCRRSAGHNLEHLEGTLFELDHHLGTLFCSPDSNRRGLIDVHRGPGHFAKNKPAATRLEGTTSGIEHYEMLNESQPGESQEEERTDDARTGAKNGKWNGDAYDSSCAARESSIAVELETSLATPPPRSSDPVETKNEHEYQEGK